MARIAILGFLVALLFCSCQCISLVKEGVINDQFFRSTKIFSFSMFINQSDFSYSGLSIIRTFSITQEEAEKACWKNGGYLASANMTKEEFDAIKLDMGTKYVLSNNSRTKDEQSANLWITSDETDYCFTIDSSTFQLSIMHNSSCAVTKANGYLCKYNRFEAEFSEITQFFGITTCFVIGILALPFIAPLPFIICALGGDSKPKILPTGGPGEVVKEVFPEDNTVQPKIMNIFWISSAVYIAECLFILGVGFFYFFAEVSFTLAGSIISFGGVGFAVLRGFMEIYIDHMNREIGDDVRKHISDSYCELNGQFESIMSYAFLDIILFFSHPNYFYLIQYSIIALYIFFTLIGLDNEIFFIFNSLYSAGKIKNWTNPTNKPPFIAFIFQILNIFFKAYEIINDILDKISPILLILDAILSCVCIFISGSIFVFTFFICIIEGFWFVCWLYFPNSFVMDFLDNFNFLRSAFSMDFSAAEGTIYNVRFFFDIGFMTYGLVFAIGGLFSNYNKLLEKELSVGDKLFGCFGIKKKTQASQFFLITNNIKFIFFNFVMSMYLLSDYIAQQFGSQIFAAIEIVILCAFGFVNCFTDVGLLELRFSGHTKILNLVIEQLLLLLGKTLVFITNLLNTKKKAFSRK